MAGWRRGNWSAVPLRDFNYRPLVKLWVLQRNLHVRAGGGTSRSTMRHQGTQTPPHPSLSRSLSTRCEIKASITLYLTPPMNLLYAGDISCRSHALSFKKVAAAGK